MRVHDEVCPWVDGTWSIEVEQGEGKASRVADDPASAAYPTPLELVGTDGVFVGRIRADLADPNAVLFWSVADNLRKGAALNAVQIGETLLGAAPGG